MHLEKQMNLLQKSFQFGFNAANEAMRKSRPDLAAEIFKVMHESTLRLNKSFAAVAKKHPLRVKKGKA